MVLGGPDKNQARLRRFDKFAGSKFARPQADRKGEIQDVFRNPPPGNDSGCSGAERLIQPSSDIRFLRGGTKTHPQAVLVEGQVKSPSQKIPYI